MQDPGERRRVGWGHRTMYRGVTGLYHPLLGVWFGVILMFGFAAGTAFQTARAVDPAVWAPAAESKLESPAADRVAGMIVQATTQWLVVIQLVVAASVVGLCIVQCTLLRPMLSRGVLGGANLARLVMLGVAVSGVLWMAGWIVPRMAEHRAWMYAADLGMVDRVEARRVFQGMHVLSERVMGGVALLVAAAAVVSPFAFRVPAVVESVDPGIGKTLQEADHG